MTATASTHAGGAAAGSSVEERATLFAAAVRERLSDLPPDELDDLLDGLQADLAERLADGDELGEADAYAEELRQAAGLPVREEQAPKKRRTMSELADVAGAGLRGWVEGSAFRRGVRDFLVSLRPVWWVARGVALPFGILGIVTFVTGAWWWFYPDRGLESFPFMVFTLGCVILSIQWGRGRWAPQRWLVWARRAASVIAAISLIPVLGIMWGRITTVQTEYVDPGTSYMSGLSYQGTEIGNIFAYDCNGQPLDGVQLFTRDGQPLVTLQDGNPPWYYSETGDEGFQYAKNPLATLPNGWSGWNVFPLERMTGTDDSGNPTGPSEAVPPPFAKVPAISNACPNPSDAGAGGDTAPPAKDGDATKGDSAKTEGSAATGKSTGTGTDTSKEQP